LFISSSFFFFYQPSIDRNENGMDSNVLAYIYFLSSFLHNGHPGEDTLIITPPYHDRNPLAGCNGLDFGRFCFMAWGLDIPSSQGDDVGDEMMWRWLSFLIHIILLVFLVWFAVGERTNIREIPPTGHFPAGLL
jgi:hypothetical protein